MKRIVSILLSITIFSGSLGLTVATHYCFGQAVKIRILFDLEDFGCGMAQMEQNCEYKDEGSANLSQHSCCDNDFEVADIDSDFGLRLVDHTPNINFLAVLIVTSVSGGNTSGVDIVVPSNHSPPLIEQDKRVLFQSFLI